MAQVNVFPIDVKPKNYGKINLTEKEKYKILNFLFLRRTSKIYNFK